MLRHRKHRLVVDLINCT